MYQCHKCERRPRFALVEMLEEHLASYHFKFSPYECQECPTTFGTESAIIGHYKNVHGMQEFTFNFRYFPSCFEVRNAIYKELEQNEMNVREKSIKLDHNYTKNELVIDEAACSTSKTSLKVKEEPLEVGEELTFYERLEEDLQDAKENIKKYRKAEDSVSKIGNIDFSEFGSDSILRNDDTLAEVLKRSDDLNKVDEEKSKKKVQCKQCGVMVSDQRSSRFYHANTKHIKLPLYECLGCEKKWCTISKSDVLKHVQAIHKGNIKLIVDHKARVRQQLRVLVELCFPKKENKQDSPNCSLIADEEDGTIPYLAESSFQKIKQELEEGQISEDLFGQPEKKKIKVDSS